MKLSPWTVAAVVLAVILVGCSETADVPENFTIVEFDQLPLSDLLDTHGGITLDNIIRAQDLVSECMAAEGFKYYAEIPNDSTPQPKLPTGREEFIASGFGITEPIAAIDEQSPEDDRNIEFRASLTEAENLAYSDALFGDGDGNSGCLATARQATTKDKSPALDIARTVQSEIAEASLNVPEVDKARRAIYQCLQGYGLDIRTDELHPESALTQRFEEEWFSTDDATESVRSWAARLWDCGYPEYLNTLFDERARKEASYLDANFGLFEELLDP